MLATIGYERSELDDFLATLLESGVEVLVDIRDRAQSRRPGFSKSALACALQTKGIEYVHLKELGDPKAGRDAARAGRYDLFRKIFGEVMETEVAQRAMGELTVLAASKKICLMCFERDQHQCHRKIVSDRLEKALNCRAVHLGVRRGVGKKAA